MHQKHPETVAQPAAEALSARIPVSARVLLVAGTTIVREGHVAPLAEALRPRAVAIHTGIRPHTPRTDVARLAGAIAEHKADVVVAIGGGSVIDAAKAARLCVGNGVFSAEGMDALLPRRGPDGIEMPKLTAPAAFSIAVPTTLSAAEYTAMGGVTRESGDHKQAFSHPGLLPDLIVLDGQMAATTPLPVWFATGARAVDHAVETWCSINATSGTDALAIEALNLLWPALHDSVSGSDGPTSRVQALRGAGASISGLALGATFGASHGIGHALGSVTNMGHGETSSVMLAHVLAFNEPVNGDRQRELAALLGTSGTLASIIGDRMRSLGLPVRLRDAGVARATLPRVAEVAARDRWVRTNPRPISQREIEAMLEAAW